MVPLAGLRKFVDGANGIHGVRKARLALDLLRRRPFAAGKQAPPAAGRRRAAGVCPDISRWWASKSQQVDKNSIVTGQKSSVS